VDGRLKAITMRSQPSLRKFPALDVEEADWEIAHTFDNLHQVQCLSSLQETLTRTRTRTRTRHA